jgi:hypothetical protein
LRAVETFTKRNGVCPLATAVAATVQRASRGPTPTDSGEWYLAARLAVTI